MDEKGKAIVCGARLTLRGTARRARARGVGGRGARAGPGLSATLSPSSWRGAGAGPWSPTLRLELTGLSVSLGAHTPGVSHPENRETLGF